MGGCVGKDTNRPHFKTQSLLQAGPGAKCGCYIRRPEAVGLDSKSTFVPLRSIDYQIDIINSLANITLVQTY